MKMKFLQRLPAICTGIIMFMSCHKPDVQSQSIYTFTNTMGREITLDIYGSGEDYNRNAARMQQYFIAPGADQKIAFEALKTYWIDWYSADYSLHNWRDTITGRFDEPYPLPRITIAAEDDAYALRLAANDTSRSILLNGGGTESTWQTTVTDNALLNGTHRFTFRKDFGGIYIYTPALGAIVSRPFRYSVTGSGAPGAFWIEMRNADGNELCEMSWNYFAGDRDTMQVSFTPTPPLTFYTVLRQ